MKKLLTSIGAILTFSATLILGWAIGQPEPYSMEITTGVQDGYYMMCDRNIRQCAALTVEDVQVQLLIHEYYRAL